MKEHVAEVDVAITEPRGMQLQEAVGQVETDDRERLE